MRRDETGKATTVILLALLCAGGAAAPVVALREPSAPAEVAAVAEVAAIASTGPASHLPIEPAMPAEVESTKIERVVTTPQVASNAEIVNDRLRGYALG